MGFFNFFKRNISEQEFQEQQKMKYGLEKTRTGFFQNIVNTLTHAQIDDDLYDTLEEQLILADVGPMCAVRLVDELAKISRSVKKASPEASLEVLLVLDAITGQNAISQAEEVCRAAGATGIVLTKLDGTPAAAVRSLCGRTWVCPSALSVWAKKSMI